jgi:hypothetical protein
MDRPDSPSAGSRLKNTPPQEPLVAAQPQGLPLTPDSSAADPGAHVARAGGEVTQSRQEQEPAGSGRQTWEAFDTPPPPNFYDDSLDDSLSGAEWQIAWALKEVRILRRGTTKELTSKLRMKEVLWGRSSGRTYYVHVSKVFRREQVDKALAEVEKIKARPYRPGWHPLPKKYKKYRRQRLESPSEEVLAQVLHEVDILEEPTIPSLHKRMENKRGGLFGTDDHGMITLYLDDNFEQQVVDRVQSFLEQHSSPAPR